MAMGINTNVMSINAQRQAAKAQDSLSTSMARLSSGLRVNTAKDDAAGLAIADRMDTQSRGMTVAIRNANDGISFTQTAEGALGSISNMLQRMRELTVQAGNSTLSSTDVSALNKEYGQLAAEVARTMSATLFNGQAVLTGGGVGFQVGANGTADQFITIASAETNVVGLTAVASASAGALVAATSAGNANTGTLAALDTALALVNDRRASIGAIQSRFDNTISNLQTSIENQSAARGRIVDADFAAESANLSRAQILQQASTAMIAQANQVPQGVMKLLN